MVMTRKCHSCGIENAWDAVRCARCGESRWNDPDGTELGRALGELERSDSAVAAAAAKIDRLLGKD